jgi:hypothetical protein
LKQLRFRAPLAHVPEVTETKPWERCAEGWEGVIAKRRDSPYEHRRSPHWLKMKCEATQELVIGGFTDPQGRRVGLGALLAGYFDGEDFVFAGKVGTGFTSKLLLDLRAGLDKLEIATSPFTKAKDCRAFARTGCDRMSSGRCRLSSGRFTENCGIPGWLVCATTSRPKRSCEKRDDHASRQGIVSRLRNHQR